jgi:hypothetical protein
MVDTDVFSVHELNAMMVELGYPSDEVMYYNFKIPGQSLDVGLRALGCDADVLNMLQYVHLFKFVELFIEHKITRINTYLQSPNNQLPKVFIEEIEDIGPSRRQLLLEWVEDDRGGELVNVQQQNDHVNLEIMGSVQQEVILEEPHVMLDSEEEQQHDQEHADQEQVEQCVAPQDQEQVEESVPQDQEHVEHIEQQQDEEHVEQIQQQQADQEQIEQQPDQLQVEQQQDQEQDLAQLLNHNMEDNMSFFMDYFGNDNVDVQNDPMDVQIDQVDDQIDNVAVETDHVAVETDKEDVDSEVDSEDDSDYIVDEDNMLEDVEVDMAEYRCCVELNEDDMELDDNNNCEVEELDPDNFDSATDEDDPPSTRAVKRINRKKRNWKGDDSTPFYVCQTFGDKKVVKDIVKRLAVQTRRQLVFTKDDKLRLRVVCYGLNPATICNERQKGQNGDNVENGESSAVGGANKAKKPGKGEMCGKSQESNVVGSCELNTQPNKKRFPPPTCPWTLFISRATENEMFVVRTLKTEHKCMPTRKVRLYTVSAIAKEVEPLLESNPNIPLKALQDSLQRKNQVQISFQKVFRAKIMALEKMEGDYVSQYRYLRDYCDELLRSNPGSTIKIDVERECNPSSESRQFKRIYICFAALKAGFLACGRQLLGLDGCFMKGPFPGQVLTAVGIDSNNGIYPVAYAVVEAETTSSWTWFLELIGDDLGLNSQSNFTFISDRQKVNSG